jgi:hypothetical protein
MCLRCFRAGRLQGRICLRYSADRWQAPDVVDGHSEDEQNNYWQYGVQRDDN